MPWIKNPSGRVVEVEKNNCGYAKAKSENEPEWSIAEKPPTAKAPKPGRPSRGK